jgi:hypothetical protein
MGSRELSRSRRSAPFALEGTSTAVERNLDDGLIDFSAEDDPSLSRIVSAHVG